MNRFFKIALFLLILLIGVGSLAIYWTFYRSQPAYAGERTLPGLSQKVNIDWDSYGIPHIYAQTTSDAYRALGYVHARDRLWQMTLAQMAAEGRFAEFFGCDLLPVDKLQRTIGIWSTAQEIYAETSPQMKRILTAYAAGVNHYVQTHEKDLSPQFALTNVQPIPWEPAHSLATARLMAWSLNVAWQSELSVAMLEQTLPTEKFLDLYPQLTLADASPSRGDSLLSAIAPQLLHALHQFEQLTRTQGLSKGSNGWAVSPDKSASGSALLAGDPHLPLSMPGVWYEAHLNINGKNTSGATLPGAPAIIIGQNDALAWTVTNVMLDDTDFYEEVAHPIDSSRYLLDSLAGEPVYEKFDTQQEIIAVKDAPDQLFTRTSTKHGPIISTIFPDSSLIGNRLISMQWTGLQPSHELEALQTMSKAAHVRAFKKGVQAFKSPALNFIAADTTGNIAQFTGAAVPLRAGNPAEVRAGWNSTNDWQGMADFERLPAKINPETGWLANANNPLAGSPSTPYMSIYWQPSDRYNRIRQYLTTNEMVSAEAFQIMQTDVTSPYARRMHGLIAPIIAEDSTLSTAQNYLQNWDYSYSTAETAASIMEVFTLRLARNTFEDEMGRDNYKLFTSYSARAVKRLPDLLQNGSPFFDDVYTATRESKAHIVRMSMRQALQFLGDSLGTDPSQWRWGNVHTLKLKPAFLGAAANQPDASPFLRSLVDKIFSTDRYPASGHAMTISNGEYAWDNPFDMIIGPSIRRIIDLSDINRARTIAPGGQSGHPFSPFYGDQTQQWLNGQYKYVYQDSSRLKPIGRLQLQPGNSSEE